VAERHGRGIGDKNGLRPVNEDELLAQFDRIPTVMASMAETHPDDVRRAVAALAAQAEAAGADDGELIEAMRAIHPEKWSTARNRNRFYR